MSYFCIFYSLGIFYKCHFNWKPLKAFLHFSTDDGKIEMTIQGNLCNVTLINTDYNDKGKWQLLIKTGTKSSLKKHSYEVSVVGRYYKYQNHSIQGLLIYKIKYSLSYTKLQIFVLTHYNRGKNNLV